MDAHQKSKLRRHTRSHLSEKFFSSILKTQGKKIRTFFVKILGNNSREKINLKTIHKQSRIFLNKVIIPKVLEKMVLKVQFLSNLISMYFDVPSLLCGPLHFI